MLFHVDPPAEHVVANSLFPNAYSMSDLVWREDGRAFTFEYNQRGHQAYRVIEVDAATGKARALVDEETKTFFDYRRANGSLSDSGRKFRYGVADGKEIIWMSERDGWSHLYMYDGATGRVKYQITKGPWMVRAVQKVDEEKRQIWFSASGMYPGQDPYFLYDYRIGFDGTGLVRLTDEEAYHQASYSHDMQYVADTWSRVDMAPVLEVRRTSDRSLVATVERGDLTALEQTGWKPPEVFVAKGRDGKTDIWGVIFRPTNFDPSKTYPVIENIYAGPQGSFVPKTFSAYSSMRPLAELGFIVVQIDGMGTANRSKAFHEVAWKNLGDAGLPDRLLWHRAVAAKYPVLRHLTRRHLRHVGRRAELARRAAVPPRVLQGGGVGVGLPRQPDGQDLVERAVDGVADRPAGTRPRPTWTTRGASRATCSSSSARWTTTWTRRPRCRS